MSKKLQITEHRALNFDLFVKEMFLLILKAFLIFFSKKMYFCNLRNFDVQISHFDNKLTRVYEKNFPKNSWYYLLGSVLPTKTYPGHIMLPTGLSWAKKLISG